MSVLLRQAHGFERFGLGRVKRPPPHLVVAESECLKEPLLHFNSAVTTTGAKPVADHGPIALLDHNGSVCTHSKTSAKFAM